MRYLHPYEERKDSYRWFQEIYLERYGEPFPSISFNLDDRGSRVWPGRLEHSMCYRRDEPERKSFVGPDWTFCHWPSCGVENSLEMFHEIRSAGEIPARCGKVAWFGNVESPGRNLPESVTRPMLVNEYGRNHPDRFDFRHSGPAAAGSNFSISMPEMVREYGCLLDIGGAGYSGRLKFLLFSGRPLFLVERLYVEYFHDGLVPFVHFIPVKSDLSDLLERHDWVLGNPGEAERIGLNARRFAEENFTIDRVLERLRFVFEEVKSHNLKFIREVLESGKLP